MTKGDRTLYLGGTCHVLRPGDFPLPPEFDRAYAASTKVYFETDLARTQSAEMQQVILTRGVLPAGTTLAQVLTPEAWREVQAYSAEAGMPLVAFQQFKPWLFTVMLAVMELQKLGVTEEGVDLRYFKQAKASGKATGELETFEQHVGFLAGLGAGHESEMIVKTLADLKELPGVLDKLLAAWRRGDVAAIDTLMLKDMRTKYPVIFKELFVQRNDAWLPKLEQLLKTPETELALVGVGHMAGPEGLLAKLRQRGYTVTQE